MSRDASNRNDASNYQESQSQMALLQQPTTPGTPAIVGRPCSKRKPSGTKQQQELPATAVGTHNKNVSNG
jgi:hypothetical protein